MTEVWVGGDGGGVARGAIPTHREVRDGWGTRHPAGLKPDFRGYW
jgi:hypothetical protein